MDNGTKITHKTSDAIGTLHQALNLIIAEAIRHSEAEPDVYGVGALSYKGRADNHVALALAKPRKLLVAGDASVSEWTDPLTMSEYLELLQPKLPEGWELDVAPGEWFEIDDEHGHIVLVSAQEE